jgi:hypothetical protein
MNMTDQSGRDGSDDDGGIDTLGKGIVVKIRLLAGDTVHVMRKCLRGDVDRLIVFRVEQQRNGMFMRCGSDHKVVRRMRKGRGLRKDLLIAVVDQWIFG